MKFNDIEVGIGEEQIEAAGKKLGWLFTELACGKNNAAVGTGLGGNSVQLLVLLDFNHILGKNDQCIQLDKRNIIWGADWIINADKKAIRAKLDEAFPAIRENTPNAAALEDIVDSKNIRESIGKHKELFPKLIETLAGDVFKRNDEMSRVETVIYACALCQELSDGLNKDDKTLIKPVGEALSALPPEMVLLPLRKHIGLSMLVKFSLDEDAVFGAVLKNVNSAL
jgi:hypothetical protein